MMIRILIVEDDIDLYDSITTKIGEGYCLNGVDHFHPHQQACRTSKTPFRFYQYGCTPAYGASALSCTF